MPSLSQHVRSSCSRDVAIQPPVAEPNALGFDAGDSPAPARRGGSSLLETLPAEMRDAILLHMPDRSLPATHLVGRCETEGSPS